MTGPRRFLRPLRTWLLVSAIVALFAAMVWVNDFITLQGERTVYTARCDKGDWVGDRCTGKLVAGERHRFRALKAHDEVFFWIAGDRSQPAGRFTQCVIVDGRNWTCKPNADAARSITLALAKGRPVVDPAANTRPFHQISKLKWVLLDYGLWFGDTAAAP